MISIKGNCQKYDFSLIWIPLLAELFAPLHAERFLAYISLGHGYPQPAFE